MNNANRSVARLSTRLSTRFTLLAALALALSAVAAQAADHTQATRTRAEVKAEVLQAIAKGQMPSAADAYLPLSAQNPLSLTTREQVRRDAAATDKTALLRQSYGG